MKTSSPGPHCNSTYSSYSKPPVAIIGGGACGKG